MEQESTIFGVKAAVISLIGLLTGFWGWLGWLVAGWVFAMVLDYVTGSLAAAKAGQWSSGRAKEGIWHKAGMFVVVIVAAGADLLIALVLKNLPVLDLPVQYPGLVCPVVLVWYIVTELGSMAENGVAMGAPIPKWLPKILDIGRDAVDKVGEELTNEKNEGGHTNENRR